jgi:hypothetical protein
MIYIITVEFYKIETSTIFQNHLSSEELKDRPKDGTCAIEKDDSKDI